MIPEEALQARYPEIPWNEPLPVTVPGVGAGLACRICIAQFGLQGRDAGRLPQTTEQFDEHMALMHGKSLSQEPGQP